ncbi:MAG: rhodanese-like domain-containing protein [Cyclobacteriaceae bacterium]|nr:rhodanese-like domain-containing protein [Cyclobacteriaceae bacterium]
MNKIVITLSIIALSFSAVSCQSTSSTKEVEQGKKQTIERVDNQKFAALLKSTENAQVIDVRTPQEYAGGYIGDATNINFMGNDFKTKISELDKTKAVFIYCQGGGRSGRALKVFQEMGFETVYELKTGYGNWSGK